MEKGKKKIVMKICYVVFVRLTKMLYVALVIWLQVKLVIHQNRGSETYFIFSFGWDFVGVILDPSTQVQGTLT